MLGYAEQCQILNLKLCIAMLRLSRYLTMNLFSDTSNLLIDAIKVEPRGSKIRDCRKDFWFSL